MSTPPKRRFRCPIQGCDRARQPHEVMCREHWYQAPIKLRSLVWVHYRQTPGSPAHRRAVFDAILYVQRLQPRPRTLFDA